VAAERHLAVGVNQRRRILTLRHEERRSPPDFLGGDRCMVVRRAPFRSDRKRRDFPGKQPVGEASMIDGIASEVPVVVSGLDAA